MHARYPCRRLVAFGVAAVAFAFFIAFVATARSETWALDVVTARVIADQQADGGVVSIVLSEVGNDLFDRLTKEAKGPKKQVCIDDVAISLGRYYANRRELRVLIRGISDNEARILADRIAAKSARVEVVELAEK